MSDPKDPTRELREKVAEQCLKSVEAVIEDVREHNLVDKLFVEKPDKSTMENFLQTIARIRYLELVVLKTFGEGMKAQPALMRELSDDLLKMMLLSFLSEGLITNDELAGFYGAEFLTGLIRQSGADLRPGARDPGKNVFERAADIVSEYAENSGK